MNERDRHVVATAQISEANTVVTNDRRPRSETAASSLDLAAVDGDTFAIGPWDESPADVRVVVDSLIAKRRLRPDSDAEMADQLRIHFPSMAEAWLSECGRRS